ncbi:MAG: succinate dehydrogenase, hydrophobic membrane anchor protein [Betaproteobacteria bacterium]|nr:succinate dehydrogenase, hydrophobic membrane anchor protein [Betaproteobacteria bacterium]
MTAYAKIPVGAHTGTGAWLLQRLTAVVMAAYTVFLLALVLWCPPANWADWTGMFSGAFVRLATMLFFLALLYHAWVGVRDIIMDYVKPTGIRLALQALVGTALVFYVVWSVSILWSR